MPQDICNTLVYPRRYLLDDITRLRAAGSRGLLLRLAHHTTTHGVRWLVRRDGPTPRTAQEIWRRREQQLTADPSQPFSDREGLLRVSATADLLPLQATYLRAEPTVDAHLYLREEDTRVLFSGFVPTAGGFAPLDKLLLVGAQMSLVFALNARPSAIAWDAHTAFLQSPHALERWARTIGPLGQHVWERLCQLRYTVIGCGRNGSALIEALAGLGVGHLTACDGDTLEPANLGEMSLVTAADLNQPKAQAVINRVRARYEAIHTADYRAVIGWNYACPAAQTAMAECDVLLCCVDSDAARLAAALAAARYHKVLIDAGTGVFVPPDAPAPARAGAAPHVEMGADVRLILPGEGCLLCCGGLRDASGGLVEMYNEERRRQRRQTGHLARAGSLHCLSHVAASEVVRLLQRLCAGRINRSQWVRYEEGADGLQRTVTNFPENNATAECFCPNAGAGRLL